MRLKIEFPAMDTPQCRATLVASSGIYERAINLLRPNEKSDLEATMNDMNRVDPEPNYKKSVGSIRTDNSRRSKNRIDDTTTTTHLDSESITGPGPDYIPAPKVSRITEMRSSRNSVSKESAVKKPKYTLKSKTPLSIPKATTDLTKGKGKAKITEDTYDIPTEDYDEPQPNAAAKGAKNSRTSTSKVVRKVAKEPLRRVKKRKSAPARTKRTLPGMSNQRAAAAMTGQKIRDIGASDDNITEAEAIPSQSKSGQITDPYQTEGIAQKGSSIRRSFADKGTGFLGQQKDGRLLDLLPDDSAIPDIDDLYDASPKPKVVSKTSHSSEMTSKPPMRAMKALTSVDLASGLASILDNIANEYDNKEVTSLTPASIFSELLKQTIEGSVNDVLTGQIDELQPETEASARLNQNSGDDESLRLLLVGNRQPPVTPKQGTGDKSSPVSPVQRCRASIKPKVLIGHNLEVVLGSDNVTIEVAASEKPNMTIIEDNEMVEEPRLSPAEFTTLEIVSLEDATKYTPGEQNIARQPHISPYKTRKRKAMSSIEIPLKKQRSKEHPQPEAFHSPSGRCRSPGSVQMMSVELAQEARESFQTELNASILPSLASPRLKARNNQATLSAGRDKILVDDHLARKQTIIGFSHNGAENQGLSSIAKWQESRGLTRTTPSNLFNAATKEEAVRKRKREPAHKDHNITPADVETSPKKRRSVSPLNHNGVGKDEDNYHETSSHHHDMVGDREANDYAIESSPPVATVQVRGVNNEELAPIKHLQVRSSKHSSQVARVDENGSPMASSSVPQIDYIGNAKRRLFEDRHDAAQASFHERESANGDSPRAFGSKMALQSIPKARPSSPAEVTTHYVPHKRTSGGLYEGVSTKKVVEPEKKLADPFTASVPRTSRGFTDRLLAGNADSRKAPRAIHDQVHKVTRLLQKEVKSVSVDVNGLLLNAVRMSYGEALEPNEGVRNPNQTARKAIEEDSDKTLVNDENQYFINDIPSEMTSSVSTDSNDGNELRSPTPEQSPSVLWNVALRPHYTKLSDAVHRIADVRNTPRSSTMLMQQIGGDSSAGRGRGRSCTASEPV